MKKTGIIIAVVVTGTLIFLVMVRRNQGSQLGKVMVTKRPPKIKLQYSTKRKISELPKITSSVVATRILREVWSKQMNLREEFVILLLNKANRVLGYNVVSKGGVSGTVADAKMIFSAAIQSNASAIILAHNHPSVKIC